jgi:hypothetical protein
MTFELINFLNIVFYADTTPDPTRQSLRSLTPIAMSTMSPLRLVCAWTGRTVVVTRGKRLLTLLGGECHPVLLERMGAGTAFKAKSSGARGAGGGSRGLMEGASEWRFVV